MTVAGFFHLVIRWWYIFVIGLGCAFASIFGLSTGQRLYSTQAEVAMNPPGTSINFETSDTTRASLVNFADVTVREFNARTPTHTLSAPRASLFGNGIRNGVSVRLADSGTQWSHSFGTPIISVQVVGSRPEQVLHDLDDVITRIQLLTNRIQLASGANPKAFIEAKFDPTLVNINSFGPTRAGKAKAEVAMVAVALCLSTIVADGIDRRKRKGRDRLRDSSKSAMAATR